MSHATPVADLATELQRLKQQENTNRENEIRLNAEKDNIQRELETLKARAQEEFGTSDLSQMRALYTQFTQEDKEAVAVFRDQVSRRATLLEDIQRRLQAHRAGQAVKA